STQSVGNDKAGLRMKCRKCGAIVSIPADEAARTGGPRVAVKKQTVRRSPLMRLLRPMIYTLVALFAVSALLFRWWFNPPPPKPNPGFANQTRNSGVAATSGASGQSSSANQLNNAPPSPPPSEQMRRALNEARAELVKNGKTSHFLELLQSV